MKQIDLEFSFRGNRNYVHGTDIYKKIMYNLAILGYSEWQYFELNVSKIAKQNMTCFLTDKKQKIDGEVANFKLLKDQKYIYGSLIENSNKKISSRYPFDENDIYKHCIIDYEQKFITYKNVQNDFTAIDVIILITKFYLENAVDKSVKWFFRTIKCSKPIDAIKFQEISMKEVMVKSIIVGFDIYMDDQLIGHGYAASIS